MSKKKFEIQRGQSKTKPKKEMRLRNQNRSNLKRRLRIGLGQQSGNLQKASQKRSQEMPLNNQKRRDLQPNLRQELRPLMSQRGAINLLLRVHLKTRKTKLILWNSTSKSKSKFINHRFSGGLSSKGS